MYKGTKLAEGDMIVGRPIRSADDPTSLLDWISRCDTSHPKCGMSSQTEALPAFAPTRLIYVGSNASPELQLRDGNQCLGPYATLSYCWGKEVYNVTTKSNLSASMIGLDISALCKTMYEAVIVTRNLQLKYIWIDALCIIQDDLEDWEREALSMSDVFSQSAITIAATSSTDSQGGLFFPRSTEPSAQLLWTVSDECPPERISFRSHDDMRYYSLVDRGPLNQRGWVFQERLLSKRIVHFTSDRLFWECQQTALEEGLTKSSTPDRRPMREFHLANLRRRTGSSEDRHWMDDCWRSVVEYYTRTQLTYKNDRLPTLAGLAKTWAKSSDDRYVAGCWQRNLALHLLWSVLSRTESTELLQRPSWSWTSFDGVFCFHALWESENVVNLVEDIVVIINGSATSKIYGGIQEGFLTLTGRVKATTFNGGRTDGEQEQHMPWNMTLDEKDYIHKRGAFDRVQKVNEMVPMLQLCRFDWEEIRTEYVMLLEPLEQHNCFERLGLGVIIWKKTQPEKDGQEGSADTHVESWFDDAPSVRIRIY
jgi:hypothetical protein